jgi:hypothetical protein
MPCPMGGSPDFPPLQSPLPVRGAGRLCVSKASETLATAAAVVPILPEW